MKQFTHKPKTNIATFVPSMNNFKDNVLRFHFGHPQKLGWALILVCWTLPLNAQKFINPDTLRINQIQTIGSHNSYRIRTQRGIFWAMHLLDPFYRGKSSPAMELNYNHLPIPEQFEAYKIRSLELDIHYDPEGGLYYYRRGNFLAFKRAASGIEALKKPGMKLLHIADVDYKSNYITFIESLQAVKGWSDAHPRHLPIYILVETKDYGPGNKIKGMGFAEVLPFDKKALNAIDEEIRAVFGTNLKQILTPDDVRGDFPTLNEAILKKGWPMLKDARGKIVFIINGGMENTLDYAEGHPSFAGRLMFSFSEPGRPEAAFLKSDNPKNSAISNLVKQGYIIRARTDEPGHQAYTNDYSNMNTAFESGAQILSTDCYKADLSLSTYQVFFPDHKVGKLNFLIPTDCRVADWGE
jgi:hypothetical protein